MKQLLIIGLLCLSQIMYSQVDWNSYQEPDNTVRTFSAGLVGSYLDSRSNNSDFTSIIPSSNYTSRKVDELSIFNFNGRLQLSDLLSTNETPNILGTNIGLTKYFNERRGLFVEGTAQLTIFFFNENLPTRTNFSDQHRLQLFLGYGRMENISRVYQAIRVNNEINPASSSDQDRIFRIADDLTQINYNDVFNNKSVDAEKQQSILDLIQQGDITISDHNQLNALNVTKFETPNLLRQGKSIRIGLEEGGQFDEASVVGSLLLDYATAINDKFHFDASASLSQGLVGSNNGIFGNIRTQLSYMPTSRFRLDWINNFGFTHNNSFNSRNFTSTILASYAVSPNVSIFGGFGYNTSSISIPDFNLFNSNSIQSNLGLMVRF